MKPVALLLKNKNEYMFYIVQKAFNYKTRKKQDYV